MLTRRHFAASTIAGATFAKGRLDLLDIASQHVKLTERHRGASALWGRIAGNPAEKESAELYQRQLKPFVSSITIEKLRFETWRPRNWRVEAAGTPIPSAMPAPFDARFSASNVDAPMVRVAHTGDWKAHRGKWLFLPVEKGRYAFASLVRDHLLYQKAVAANAAGLVFALDTPADATWRYIVPVDKPYAEKDGRYPDGRRPIPCFAVDARDASILARESRLSARIDYLDANRWDAHNVVARLEGAGEGAIAIFNHIDSFFSGACDNASGIAVLAGLAEQLAALPKNRRRKEIFLMGISAHHDAAAGFRDFLERDKDRAARIKDLILLEHLDAVDSADGKAAGWPYPLNDYRTAYLGSRGWPELQAAIPRLIQESKLMSRAPVMRNACIADLFVTCGSKRSFCLMNAPPFYHSDRDTIDRISGPGLERAVDFHMRLLHEIGAIQL